jgi:hypothetical protein
MYLLQVLSSEETRKHHDVSMVNNPTFSTFYPIFSTQAPLYLPYILLILPLYLALYFSVRVLGCLVWVIEVWVLGVWVIEVWVLGVWVLGVWVLGVWVPDSWRRHKLSCLI